MTKDLTTGKIMPILVKFTIPLVLGNLFQLTYNAVDSIIVGHFVGKEALAAVGICNPITTLMILFLNGLCMGAAILMGMQYGAKDYDTLHRQISTTMLSGVVFSVTLTVLCVIFAVPMLKLIQVDPSIMDLTAEYLRIIFWGLMFTFLYNFFSSTLRALGDSNSPLYFLIISAVINAGLDVLFIVKFHMGVEGCAYATVIAQGISALLCLVYIIQKFDILKLQKTDFAPDVSMMQRLLSIGVPISITAIGTIIVQSAINVFGADYIAGYAAAGKLQNMVNTIFIAFGATIATYVGQNRGAGRLDRVRQGVKDTQIMILIAAAAFFLIIHFLAGKLTLIFVDSSKTLVIDAANQYFKTVSWCYPFLGSIFLYRNALQGMGYGLVPMLGGVFELMARAGVVALVLHLGGGFVQTCLSDPAAWISALIPLIPYYFYKMRQYSLQESKKVL